MYSPVLSTVLLVPNSLSNPELWCFRSWYIQLPLLVHSKRWRVHRGRNRAPPTFPCSTSLMPLKPKFPHQSAAGGLLFCSGISPFEGIVLSPQCGPFPLPDSTSDTVSRIKRRRVLPPQKPVLRQPVPCDSASRSPAPARVPIVLSLHCGTQLVHSFGLRRAYMCVCVYIYIYTYKYIYICTYRQVLL